MLYPFLSRLICLIAFWCALISGAHAQGADALNTFLKKRADAFMVITGYSLTPDVTTGSLSINDRGAGNPNLQMISLGGGDRLSKDMPLYLEGTLAVNRYNPSFIGNIGNTSVDIPVHWNSITGTGGVGWDFPLTNELRIRPIANIMLGHLESDLSLASRAINNRTGVDLEFLNGGRMNTYGLGGSLMLDYENYKPEREIDVELRYTNIEMNTFDTSKAVQGSANSQSLSLWARNRLPTPLTFFSMPIRSVMEFAHTEFLGDLRGALGFNSLSSLGAGIEFDRSQSEPLFSRVRIVFRYQFGQNVSGTSIGLAASF
jgi:hypothetical protein